MTQFIALILNAAALAITLSWLFGIPSLDYASQGAVLTFITLFNFYTLVKMRRNHIVELTVARMTIETLTAALHAMMAAMERLSIKYSELYEKHKDKP